MNLKFQIVSFSAMIAILILFSWNCSKPNNPLNPKEEILSDDENFPGNLKIKTEKLEYILSEITTGNFIVINASLTNISQDTFYTKLGDGFNASIDQDYLSIAKYTDGYFEKNTGINKWSNLELGIMSEGSRIIRILPSTKYNLVVTAHLDDKIKGKFRLKINYYRTFSQNPANPLEDISNIFLIHNDN